MPAFNHNFNDVLRPHLSTAAGSTSVPHFTHAAAAQRWNTAPFRQTDYPDPLHPLYDRPNDSIPSSYVPSTYDTSDLAGMTTSETGSAVGGAVALMLSVGFIAWMVHSFNSRHMSRTEPSWTSSSSSSRPSSWNTPRMDDPWFSNPSSSSGFSSGFPSSSARGSARSPFTPSSSSSSPSSSKWSRENMKKHSPNWQKFDDRMADHINSRNRETPDFLKTPEERARPQQQQQQQKERKEQKERADEQAERQRQQKEQAERRRQQKEQAERQRRAEDAARQRQKRAENERQERRERREKEEDAQRERQREAKEAAGQRASAKDIADCRPMFQHKEITDDFFHFETVTPETKADKLKLLDRAKRLNARHYHPDKTGQSKEGYQAYDRCHTILQNHLKALPTTADNAEASQMPRRGGYGLWDDNIRPEDLFRDFYTT